MNNTPLFPTGQVLITPCAEKLLSDRAFAPILDRHFSGDWGDVCPEDAAENELSLKNGNRLMSVYMVNGEKVWIITEADRSVTTILLPDEY